MTHKQGFRSLRSLQPCLSTPLVNKSSSPEVLWSGVPCRRSAEVAGESGHRNVVYRTRKSLGERILRELQREAAGRVSERRDFLLAEGGTDRDREVASRVQHEAAALGAGI